MRLVVAAVALLVAIADDSCGQSSQQPAIPSQNAVPAEERDKGAASTEKKTELPPEITVNVRGTLDTPTKSGGEQSNRQHSNRWDKFWDNFYDAKVTDILLAIFTFFVAIYTALLWRYNKITERAYVSGGGYFPGDPTTGWRGDTFQLTIDNYGKTPAFVTHVDIGYWWLRHGHPPDPPPCTRQHVLSAVLPPGKEGLKMDVQLHRDKIDGDVIFGRFFFEDIFARRWWTRKRRVRSSGFILRISDKNETLAIDAPRVYTKWN